MPEQAPTTLVLLASEQLWPNIHSIEHWAKGLKRVLIYQSSDSRSVEPAKKLAAFCKERHAAVTVIPAQGDATPQAVAAQLADWRKQFRDGDWVVNATGGTKLMYDGAADFRQTPGVQVVYRELGPANAWFQLGRSPDGTPTATPMTVPADVTDRIPVEKLIRTLWGADGLAIEFGKRVEPLSVFEITRGLIDNEGRWPAAFAAANSTFVAAKTGDWFEVYVGAALLALGLSADNIAWSVEQRGPEGKSGQPTQEVDLVVNHGARLLVIDCKLRTQEEEGREVERLTSQLRQATHTARRMGGLGGEVLLLRPNRELSETERQLASDLRVQVIDRTKIGNFFRNLADFVRVRELPESLAKADALLADAWNVARAFPSSGRMHKMSTASVGGPVVEMEKFCGDWARETKQNWVVTRLRSPIHYLQYANNGRATPPLEDDLKELLGRFGSVFQLESSNSGDTLYALFAVPAEQDAAFHAFLAGRVGKPLLDPPA